MSLKAIGLILPDLTALSHLSNDPRTHWSSIRVTAFSVSSGSSRGQKPARPPFLIRESGYKNAKRKIAFNSTSKKCVLPAPEPPCRLPLSIHLHTPPSHRPTPKSQPPTASGTSPTRPHPSFFIHRSPHHPGSTGKLHSVSATLCGARGFKRQTQNPRRRGRAWSPPTPALFPTSLPLDRSVCPPDLTALSQMSQ